MSVNRLNELVLGKRGVTADTALRLARRLRDDAAVLDALAGRLGFAPGDQEELGRVIRNRTPTE